MRPLRAPPRGTFEARQERTASLSKRIGYQSPATGRAGKCEWSPYPLPALTPFDAPASPAADRPQQAAQSPANPAQVLGADFGRAQVAGGATVRPRTLCRAISCAT